MMAAALDSQPEDLPDGIMGGCPVRPLGHLNGVYYFLSPSGELRSLSFDKFSENALVSLFDARTDWLVAHFPYTGESKRRQNTFEWAPARNALQAACVAEDHFDPNTAVRGVGVWRAEGEGGLDRLIVHCGDHLVIDGKIDAAGQRIGSQIFPAKPRIAGLAGQPATIDDGQAALDLIHSWQFSRPDLDPLLILGFIGQAMLGGAPGWRAHLYVTALAGAGKSWLAQCVSAMLGAAAHPSVNNFTEPGLRQALTGEARCLVLDESEHEDGGGRVKAVIELLRHMSGGEGSQAVRGTSGGAAKSYSVTGCAYLSSILHIPLQPQDRSRITSVKLKPLPADPDASERVRAGLADMKRLSPFFRRRMVDGWGRFRQSAELYRAAFLKAGMKPRGADQLATLFAGKETLLSDVVPMPEAIAADVALAAPLLDVMREDNAADEGQLCLNHLLSYVTDFREAGARRTIGQMIEDAMQAVDGGEKGIVKALAAYGVKYRKKGYRGTTAHAEGLFIAHQAVGLAGVFSGTRWGAGAWTQALEYLPGVRPSPTPHKFAGATSRAVEIPISLIRAEVGDD